MPRIPRKLPGTSPYAAEWNAMIDYMTSLRPMQAPGVLLQHTPFGVMRQATAKSGGPQSGGVVYRGVYDATKDYDVNDLIYTSPTSDQRMAWICEISNGAASPQTPTWPEPVDPTPLYWRALSIGDVVSNVQRFRIKSVGGDYLVCVTWDGTTEGGSYVQVAKPAELRHSLITESVEGVPISYTYATRTSNLDGQRTATATGYVDQVEIVVPVFNVDQEIWAVESPAGGTGEANTFIDLNLDGRMWCQIY